MAGIVILVPEKHGSVRIYTTSKRACIHMVEQTHKPTLAGPNSWPHSVDEALQAAREMPESSEEE